MAFQLHHPCPLAAFHWNQTGRLNSVDKLADRIRYYESTIDSDRVAYEHSDDLIRKFKEDEVYDNIIPQIRDVELKYRIYLKLSEQ